MGAQRNEFVMQKVVDEVAAFRPVRDEFTQLFVHAARHDCLPVNEFLDFCQRILRLSETLTEKHRVGSNIWKPIVFAHADFVKRELFLYAATVLMQQREGHALMELTERVFFMERYGEMKAAGFGRLGHVAEQGEVERQYLGLIGARWISPLGHWHKENATLQSVPWEDLATTDLLLYMKSAVDRSPALPGDLWVPFFGPYCERIGKLPLCARWISRREMTPWLQFFGASDVEDLKVKLRTAFPEGMFGRVLRLEYGSVSMEALLGMDDWGKLK